MKFEIEYLIKTGVNDKNWIIKYLSRKVGYTISPMVKNTKHINEINKKINRTHTNDEIETLYKQIRGAWASKTHREQQKENRPKQLNISITEKSKRKVDRIAKTLNSTQSDIIERAIAIMYDELLPSRTIKKSTPYINRDIILLLMDKIEERDKIIRNLKRSNSHKIETDDLF